MIHKIRKFSFTNILKLHQTCISNAFIVMDLKNIFTWNMVKRNLRCNLRFAKIDGARRKIRVLKLFLLWNIILTITSMFPNEHLSSKRKYPDAYFGLYNRLQVIDVFWRGGFSLWNSWRVTDPPFDTCMRSSTRFFYLPCYFLFH